MAKAVTTKEPESKKKSMSFNLDKVSKILSVAFFAIWILVGVFALLVILQGFRQGAYSNLLSFKETPSVSDTEVPQIESPSTVNLEGIGAVDVACAQSALSGATIQKLVESKDINTLTAEERTKFEPCLVDATPSASPAQ